MGARRNTYNRDYRVATRTVTAGTDSWTVDFTYGDADGLLTIASHSAGGITLLRDGLNHGLVTGTTMTINSRTMVTSRALNGFAEVDLYEATLSMGGTSDTIFREEVLLRDALGRIVIKSEQIDGGPTNAYRYRYDESGRLTHVWEWNESAQPPQAGTLLEHYEYGNNGNRISTNVVGLAFGNGPGTEPVNLLDTEISYDDQDRLLDYGNISYTWTPDGRLASKTVPGVGTTIYTYDVLGNLRRVAMPGKVIDYIIDGRNRRIGKIVDGNLEQAFLYKDGLNPIAELDGSGVIVSRFVYASKRHVPDFMIKPDPSGDKVYRIISDHLGSVRLIVDMSTGETVQRRDYDAFGRVAWDANLEPPSLLPFGFAGGLYEPDTGLVRFGVRDYDADIGRWTTKDPILFDGRDTNLYSYSKQDPANKQDSNGRIVGEPGQRQVGMQCAVSCLTPKHVGLQNPISVIIELAYDLVCEVMCHFGYHPPSRPSMNVGDESVVDGIPEADEAVWWEDALNNWSWEKIWDTQQELYDYNCPDSPIGCECI